MLRARNISRAAELRLADRPAIRRAARPAMGHRVSDGRASLNHTRVVSVADYGPR